MDSTYLLGAIIGPVYLVLGLSMFLQQKAWVRRVKALVREDEERVMFSLGELILGLIVVLRHNVWEISPWLIITLTGWAMLFEALAHLLVPEKYIKKILTKWNHAQYYKIGGGVMIIIGIWLSYLVY